MSAIYGVGIAPIIASEIMKDVSGMFVDNVFKVGDTRILIIEAVYGRTTYRLLNEKERIKWVSDNTPCCGDQDHIGWCCDKDFCIPF